MTGTPDVCSTCSLRPPLFFGADPITALRLVDSSSVDASARFSESAHENELDDVMVVEDEEGELVGAGAASESTTYSANGNSDGYARHNGFGGRGMRPRGRSLREGDEDSSSDIDAEIEQAIRTEEERKLLFGQTAAVVK